MIKESQKFVNIMKELYESKKITTNITYSFEDIMHSNETRLSFLNQLFDDIEKDTLSDECVSIFQDNIDFIKSFLNGDFNKSISINNYYAKDMEDNLIIPTQSDLDYLYSLIEANLLIYETYYKNKEFVIKLPDNTFNMNMTRILKIEDKNLAHLFGLTQSEPVPDEKRNILKKYYLNHFDTGEEIETSIKLLKWFISDEGKKEISRIIQKTLEFVEKDKKKYPESYEKKYPNSYDELGNLKKGSLEAFKKRFSEDPNNEGLQYPILLFSRCICKCVNNLNFLNMVNATQMVLDYNAPIGEKDEKDIFIINATPINLLNDLKKYLSDKNTLISYFNMYGKNPKKDEEIENFLFSHLIKGNDKREKKEQEIRDYLNLFQVYDYVGKNDIKSKSTKVEDKLRNLLSILFDSNIHIIGFGTDFERNNNNEIILKELSEESKNFSHCDTSIFTNIADLIDKYYKRGRSFFIDKIYSNPSCNEYIRISNPHEELYFLESMKTIDNVDNNSINKLIEQINLFDTKYKNYINSNNNSNNKTR